MLTTDLVLTILFFWFISFVALKLTGTFDLFTFAFCGFTSTILFSCAFCFSRFLAGLLIIS